MGRTKCDYIPKDPKQCMVSFVAGVSQAFTEYPAAVLTPLDEPTGLSPSSVHLERGHRYGMHTSPGGRWCRCGTCPLHSRPMSAVQIYLHSLLFSRELNCKQQDQFVSSGNLSVAGGCDCWLFIIVTFPLIFKGQCYYSALPPLMQFSLSLYHSNILNQATAKIFFSLAQALTEETLL